MFPAAGLLDVPTDLANMLVGKFWMRDKNLFVDPADAISTRPLVRSINAVGRTRSKGVIIGAGAKRCCVLETRTSKDRNNPRVNKNKNYYVHYIDRLQMFAGLSNSK